MFAADNFFPVPAFLSKKPEYRPSILDLNHFKKYKMKK